MNEETGNGLETEKQTLGETSGSTSPPPVSARRPPIRVTVGSATVRVYPRASGKRWDVVYRLNGRRHLESRGSEAAATTRARTVAKLMDKGRANMLTLRPSDAAAYCDAMKLLAPTGVSLGLAVLEYVTARQLLGNAGSLLEAVRFYLRARTEPATAHAPPEERR